jgi:uncharacterized protein YidB (DUF937 family)
MPSMTALLALLAVAGFQNRDKIGEFLNGARNQGQTPAGQVPTGQPPQEGGMLGGLGGLLGGGSLGSVLSGGLGGLLDQFQQNGHGEVANSWVKDGPDKTLDNTQLSQAIGPDVLAQLSQQTGLSQEELLTRLSRELPAAVDKMTPEGRLPTEAEAAKLVGPGTTA